MAKKNQTVQITSDDKSENFDYLADADKGAEWETMPTLTNSESKDTPVDDYNPGIYMGVAGDILNDDRPVTLVGSRAEYDDGSPVPAEENQLESVITIDNKPPVMVRLQELLIHEAVRLASCGDGECLEDDTQFGGRIFSLTDVILYCYRLEISKSDAEIGAFVHQMLKSGILMKAQGRGNYQATAIMRMSIKSAREIAEKKLKF